MNQRALTSAIALAASLALAPAAMAAETLCLEMQPETGVGGGMITYKFQVSDLGDGIFDLAGRARFQNATVNPPIESWRLVRGVAGLLPDGLEISVDTSDISDWRSTTTVEESLHVSSVHMLLDPGTLSGSFHAVNLSYSTDPTQQPATTGLMGAARAVSCPF